MAAQADVRDGRNLRREALACKVPIVTTLAGARATVQVRSAQDVACAALV